MVFINCDHLQFLSQNMRNLADKAYELSLKCNLKEEARLIQVEERKLANF